MVYLQRKINMENRILSILKNKNLYPHFVILNFETDYYIMYDGIIFLLGDKKLF
jgi:hypothetical protein